MNPAQPSPEQNVLTDLPQAIRSMLELTEASVKAAQQAARSSREATAALPEIRSLLSEIRLRSYVKRLALELLILLLLGTVLYWHPELLMSSEDRQSLRLGRQLSAAWTALPPNEQQEWMGLLDSTSKPSATSPSEPN